jgi:CRP/FNR family cyclic AMP-dependent transcriptional regulator
MPPITRELLLLERLPAALRPRVGVGDIRQYRKGQLLLREGEPGDHVFFLLEGRVRAFSSAGGTRELSFSVDNVGDSFGELVLDGGPRSTSVIAEEPTTCVAVPSRVVWELVGTDADFARALVLRLIARTRLATERARELALFDVYGRLRLLLEHLAQPAGDDGVRVLGERLTHQAIASRVGASREMISRLLKDLERGGYIRTARASLTLLRSLPERW